MDTCFSAFQVFEFHCREHSSLLCTSRWGLLTLALPSLLCVVKQCTPLLGDTFRRKYVHLSNLQRSHSIHRGTSHTRLLQSQCHEKSILSNDLLLSFPHEL